MLPKSDALTASIREVFCDGQEHSILEVVAACGHRIPPEIAARDTVWQDQRQRRTSARTARELVEIGRLRIIKNALRAMGAKFCGCTNRLRWSRFVLRPAVRQGRIKLTADDVREIRRKRAGGVLLQDLAREYGVNSQYVSKIVHRRAWKHVE